MVQKIINNKIAIIGLGRVGLPLALYCADKGYKVVGFDINEERIKALNKHIAPFHEEGMEELLNKLPKNQFKPTVTPRDIQGSRTLVITVGTPLDAHFNPDHSQIHSALKLISSHITKGALIILRSTVTPGFTQQFKYELEAKTDFTVGKDIFLSFCPERIAEGKALIELPDIPQIIGADDVKSLKKTKTFFRPVAKSVLPTDSLSAELVKLFNNIYRYINFAIGNEFMMIAQTFNREIHSLVHLANYRYRRGGPPLPGLTSGPCLYKDSFYLINKTPYAHLTFSAWKINEGVPEFLVDRIKKIIDLKGKKVAICGVAFKRGIDDDRYSLSHRLKKQLLSERAVVALHDPVMKIGDFKETVKDADVVFIATNHDYYKTIGIREMRRLIKRDALICDIWNIFGRSQLIFSLQKDARI